MASATDIPRIALHQFGPQQKFAPLPTFDPHCLVAQTYMKMAGVPFVENNSNNPNASPLKKLPILAINEVKTVVHTDIISELSSMVRPQVEGYNLDSKLSEADSVDSEAWISLVQNRLHIAQLYNWWMEQGNYDEVISMVFSRSLPFPLNWFAPGRYKKQVSEQLSAAGLLESRAVYEEAAKCYKALSSKLGHKQYFFGDHPSSLDAVVFGFLATQFIPNLPVRQLHYLITQHENLVQYINRILKRYFSTESDVLVDTEPAQRWLKSIQEEKAAAQKIASETPSSDRSSAWAIAVGIGAASLFLASQNVQVAIGTQWLQKKLGIDSESSSHGRPHSREEDEERARWFGPGGSTAVVDESRRNPHYHVRESDLDENPMKRVHAFAPDEDQDVFIGDDGDAYDWDEQYLEEMETGSDIPEDHEDLGDEEDDDYDNE